MIYSQMIPRIISSNRRKINTDINRLAESDIGSKSIHLGFLTPKVRDILQIISVASSVAAITFQTTVLYPWNAKISENINNLSQKILPPTSCPMGKAIYPHEFDKYVK
jgi:hypothetical protein